MSEWSIGKTAVFPSQTQAFSQKYTFDKIFGMRLVVLLKYMYCTIDKTTGAGTGHTTHKY